MFSIVYFLRSDSSSSQGRSLIGLHLAQWLQKNDQPGTAGNSFKEIFFVYFNCTQARFTNVVPVFQCDISFRPFSLAIFPEHLTDTTYDNSMYYIE